MDKKDFEKLLVTPTVDELKEMMRTAPNPYIEIIPNKSNLRCCPPLEEDCGGVVFEQYNSEWWLSEAGDMYGGYYSFINADRLDEQDWLLHLMGKKWFDANTFLPAYMEACRRAGLREVKIITQY